MVIASQISLDLAAEYCRRGAATGDCGWFEDVDRILSRVRQTEEVASLRSVVAAGKKADDPKAVFRDVLVTLIGLVPHAKPPSQAD